MVVSSAMHPMAEKVGFEPTDACTSHAFEACPFGRSGTSPSARLAGDPSGSRLLRFENGVIAGSRTRHTEPIHLTRSSHFSGGASTSPPEKCELRVKCIGSV